MVIAILENDLAEVPLSMILKVKVSGMKASSFFTTTITTTIT
jgi:hypothetical protein